MLTSTGSIWEKLTKPKRYKSLTAIDSTSNRPIEEKKKKKGRKLTATICIWNSELIKATHTRKFSYAMQQFVNKT